MVNDGGIQITMVGGLPVGRVVPHRRIDVQYIAGFALLWRTPLAGYNRKILPVTFFTFQSDRFFYNRKKSFPVAWCETVKPGLHRSQAWFNSTCFILAKTN